MKHAFYIGQLVNIVPYDDVSDDYGIEKHCWEYQRAKNPQKIVDMWDNGECIAIDNDRYDFTWPEWAFVPHDEYSPLCSADDLI